MNRSLHLLLFLFFVGGLCLSIFSSICVFPRHLLMGLTDILLHIWCSFVTWRWFVRSKDKEFKFWKP